MDRSSTTHVLCWDLSTGIKKLYTLDTYNKADIVLLDHENWPLHLTLIDSYSLDITASRVIQDWDLAINAHDDDNHIQYYYLREIDYKLPMPPFAPGGIVPQNPF